MPLREKSVMAAGSVTARSRLMSVPMMIHAWIGSPHVMDASTRSRTRVSIA